MGLYVYSLLLKYSNYLAKPVLGLLIVILWTTLWYTKGANSVQSQWDTFEAQRGAISAQLKAKADAETKQLTDLVSQLGVDYEHQLSKVAELSTVNRRLARSAGLWDKQKANPGLSQGGHPESPAGVDGAPTDRRLSDEATEFLLTITEQADRNTVKLKACQRYVETITQRQDGVKELGR